MKSNGFIVLNQKVVNYVFSASGKCAAQPLGFMSATLGVTYDTDKP